MRRIKTEEEFLSELHSVNKSIVILSPFNGLTKQKVLCQCTVCNNTWETFPYLLLDGHGCKECNKRALGDFYYDVGDVINTNSRNLLIINREYRSRMIKRSNKKPYVQNRKYYQYKCLNCENIAWIIECRLKSGDGCSNCGHIPNKLIQGVNDISTILPDIAKLFKDKTIPSNSTKGNKKTALFLCPDCGKEIKKRIDTVCYNGLCCPCNDSWSYPNKFIYALLNQIKAMFTPEKIFEWSEGKKYDEYVEYNGETIIIEMHGAQHYEKPIRINHSVEKEKENDIYKYELAIKNNIDHYFVIDCRKSEKNYIRESINSSGLLTCLNIADENVDWDTIDVFATKNFVKRICEFYSAQLEMSSHDVAEYFSINHKVTQRYLRQGTKLGWCNYDGHSDRERRSFRTRSKAVCCLTISKSFKNATEAALYLGLPDSKNNGRSIRNAIKQHKTYHGYLFEYCDNIDEKKE